LTPRLKLRWMEDADAEAHYAVFSDPEVARYWSSGPWTALDPRNTASARVLEKLGFRKEGCMPERWIVQGEPPDTV